MTEQDIGGVYLRITPNSSNFSLSHKCLARKSFQPIWQRHVRFSIEDGFPGWPKIVAEIVGHIVQKGSEKQIAEMQRIAGMRVAAFYFGGSGDALHLGYLFPPQ